MLRIIHTSDVHIGAKFLSFGKKAQAQRQALCDVFSKIIDRAISEKAHLLLMAGDLFDSNFPSYQSVSFVKQQFRRLNEARIYAAVVPGTHDCLSKESIYKREDFTRDFPFIHIFDHEKETMKEFPDLDLALFAKPNMSNKSTESPVAFLKDAHTRTKAKYKVAMAHGSVQLEGKSAADDMPITLPEIADSGMHYLALGHWHGAQEFSFGSTLCWYSGSPEITYQEGKGGLGQGYIMQVELDEKVQVKPVKIIDKEVKELSVDMQVYEYKENVVHELEKITNPNMVLVVHLSGFISADVNIDPLELEEEFRDRFFSIKVKNTTLLKIPEGTQMDYPEELVIGQFVRIAKKQLEAAQDPEEKRLIQDALHIGIAELEGKNVLE